MTEQNHIFAGLNPNQKKAVEVITGPLLILAGAGSGKTKCLTHRIANLLDNGTHGSEILAVTFTNKAAKEMKERIEKLCGGTAPRSIGTFHSICVRILREDAENADLGISKNFVIFDTSDTQNLMKMCIKELHMDPKETKPRAILSHISSAKNTLNDANEKYFSEIGMDTSRFTDAVNKLAPLYKKKLKEHNACDFDDLLKYTVELFEKNPEVLAKYRQRWNHLCVDEYQDTNFAQYRMVRLLSDKHQNLCVIGDDHQSIYSFRGADFRNILNFEKDFPQAKVVKLEQNYRSSANILLNANALISKNNTGVEKNLWTENHPGSPIKVMEVFNERDEGNYITDGIKEKIADEGANYSDFAILYRMNAQSRAIEEALMRSQIPYQIIGGTKFFERKEIKDLIAYLRLIFNPRDDVSFLRIINVPSRKLGAATIDIVKKYAKNYTMSLFEILEAIDEIPELNDKKKADLKAFQSIIKNLQKTAETEPISILLDRLIDKINFMAYLNDGTMEGESRIQNVKELFSVAGKYDVSDDSLASFLEGVALIADIDNMKGSTDAVTLMTVHASKGLEFPNVFLPGWEDGIFPGSASQFSQENLEEERRLGYVAITRAEKHCTIMHARQRMIFGKTEYKVPSRFINELDPEGIEKISTVKDFDGQSSLQNNIGSYNRRPKNPEAKKYFGSATSSTTPNRPPSQSDLANMISNPPKTKNEALFGVEENESTYKIGDKINHSDYGNGTILGIHGDVFTAAFEGKGMQKFVGSVSDFEKID